jgi:hypothetical protein
MDEFLKAWSELQHIAVPVIEYRIYYDPTTGVILDYTNEVREGTYLTVDRETFAKHRFDLKVKKGVLVKVTPSVGKLRPSKEGQACHPTDITIIVEPAEPAAPATFWKIHTYD